MNPIPLIEARAAARSAVLGALATDPVVSRQAVRARTRDRRARLSRSKPALELARSARGNSDFDVRPAGPDAPLQ
jgi:hypothetical protein